MTATSSKKLLHLYCAGVLLLTWLLSVAMQAQTYSVIHTFNGSTEGANPTAGLSVDSSGNLFGTATYAGAETFGTVYRLRRSGSNWIFDVLSAFTPTGSGGYFPSARVVFGPDGALYGTASGGGSYNSGVVYKLTSSPAGCTTALCPWKEAVLYNFSGRSDGASPNAEVLFDSVGDIYGTTISGGLGNGVVYQLTHSDNGWLETPIHTFNGTDGSYPASGLSVDMAGNLYGTTAGGGLRNDGTVFELSRSSGWAEYVLYHFDRMGYTGSGPLGGVILDASGNLFGATTTGNVGRNGGAIFELSQSAQGWNFNLLNVLSGLPVGPRGPRESLVMDATGSLYGTTYGDGAYAHGSVFKLSRSNGGWIYQDLHDFTGGSDGGNPISNVVIDAQGNLYGTTEFGGDVSFCGGDTLPPGCGVIWEITP